MRDAGKAVFLSYASQDAEAARRICDALRVAGVEVWFDQSELRGGDAWDAKIRKQIKDCALFVPIISANTQARLEGYFRLEWHLAERRMQHMHEDAPFLLPVVIDDVAQDDAKVPTRFLEVQWTSLREGETPPQFCERVKALLGGEGGNASPRSPRAGAETTSGRLGETSLLRSLRRWAMPVGAGVLLAAALVLWQPWRKAQPVATAPATPGISGSPASPELASIRARIVPDRWTREDFETLKPILDRRIQANPEQSDAWALRSLIASLQILRTFDYGTAVLMAGRSDAERALRLAPASPLGELALGLHYVAMTTRGGDPNAAGPHIERALAGLSRDTLTRYAETAYAAWTLRSDVHDRLCFAWLKEEPTATFPLWVLGTHRMYERKAAEAEQWAERGAQAENNITAIRSLVTLAETKFFLRADIAGARAMLDRVPATSQSVHRVVLARWMLALADRNWDEAIQHLARLPDTVLYDRAYHGPKALLAGIAHFKAGRTSPATAQFRDAERILRDLLRADADDEELRSALALTLAYAGRASEARDELAAIEPLVRGRPAYLYSGHLQARLAETHAVLGDVDTMLPWLRKIFAGPSAVPYTAASLRLDPRFETTMADARVIALLAEFTPRETRAPAEAAGAKSAAPDKSIAVLAFENLSGDKENEYFSDGISEELLNVLAKLPGLKVCARTSAFSFKGKNAPIPEVARQLGVAYVVEGSVRKSGTQVRIAARLINARDGTQIWADDFREELKDVFALQDKIAGSIAKNLQLKLGDAPRVTKAIDPEAHRLILQGRHFWRLRTEEGFARAETDFSEAAKLAPQWAPAHAALADLWAIRGLYGLLDGAAVPQDFIRARAAAARALALDPDLADPHAALGLVSTIEGRAAEAREHFDRALALAPNHAAAHDWLGDLEQSTGRLDRALQRYRIAAELDPLSPFILSDLGRTLPMARRFAEALQMLDRAEALQPGRVRLGAWRASVLLQLGRRPEAAAAVQAVLPKLRSGREDVGEAGWLLVHVLRALGRYGDARELGAALLEAVKTDPARRALVRFALGETDEAFALIERASTTMTIGQYLFWHPMFDAIREQPRFEQLLAKLGRADQYKVARETLARMLREQATTQ